MVRNTLEDANNILFETLERLSDESLADEDLKKEIVRAHAIGEVVGQIRSTQKLALQVVDTLSEISRDEVVAPKMLINSGRT